MIKPSILDNKLILEVEGLDKVWTLKSRLELNINHVKNLHIEKLSSFKGFQGLRSPGTYIPHVIRAGTFIHHNKKVFWDVHKAEKVVVLELDDEAFSELVIEVNDPEGFVAELQEKLG